MMELLPPHLRHLAPQPPHPGHQVRRMRSMPDTLSQSQSSLPFGMDAHQMQAQRFGEQFEGPTSPHFFSGNFGGGQQTSQMNQFGQQSTQPMFPQGSNLSLALAEQNVRNGAMPCFGNSPSNQISQHAMLVGTVAALSEENGEVRSQWKSDVERLESELSQLRSAASWALPQLGQSPVADASRAGFPHSPRMQGGGHQSPRGSHRDLNVAADPGRFASIHSPRGSMASLHNRAGDAACFGRAPSHGSAGYTLPLSDAAMQMHNAYNSVSSPGPHYDMGLGHRSDAAVRMGLGHNAQADRRESSHFDAGHLSDAVIQMHNANVARDSLAFTRDSVSSGFGQVIPRDSVGSGFGQGITNESVQLAQIAAAVQEVAMSRNSSRGILPQQQRAGSQHGGSQHGGSQRGGSQPAMSRHSSRGLLNFDGGPQGSPPGQMNCGESVQLGETISMLRGGGDAARVNEAAPYTISHNPSAEHRPGLSDVVMQMHNSNASNCSRDWPTNELPRHAESSVDRRSNLDQASQIKDLMEENDRLDRALRKSQQEASTLREEKKSSETAHARDIRQLECMLEDMQKKMDRLSKLPGADDLMNSARSHRSEPATELERER